MASVSVSHSHKRESPRLGVSQTALRQTGYNQPFRVYMSPEWPTGKESRVDRIVLLLWHELRKY